MYGKVYSSCLYGIDGKIIETEIDIQRGLPHYQIVGLPDSAIRESLQRVRAAIQNSGYEFPLRRITINLAPADIRKEGTSFDLAIALGILIASGQWQWQNTDSTLIIGELALDGTIRPIPGALSMVENASRCGFKQIILPYENRSEAALVKSIDAIYGVQHLNDFRQVLQPQSIHQINHSRDEYLQDHEEDFSDVYGQLHAKRALTVAAAGMHNVLFIGPPGSGKSMLFKRLTTIMPELSEQESMEVSKIYSIIQPLDEDRPLILKRPFRSVHHNTSLSGLIGGGNIPRPGEISLAHCGVLFLDELPEFSRSIIESLRQPLEEGKIKLSRAKTTVTYPSRFILAGAMNPCPCGYYGGDSTVNCRCTPLQIKRYRNKISGPLLDRIDLQVEVPRLDIDVLLRDAKSAEGKIEPPPLDSHTMKQRVMTAMARQSFRYRNESIQFNSELRTHLIHKYCQLNADSEHLLRQSFKELHYSARAYHRLLKLARTIADLDDSESIEVAHVAEALQYRILDRVHSDEMKR